MHPTLRAILRIWAPALLTPCIVSALFFFFSFVPSDSDMFFGSWIFLLSLFGAMFWAMKTRGWGSILVTFLTGAIWGGFTLGISLLGSYAYVFGRVSVADTFFGLSFLLGLAVIRQELKQERLERLGLARTIEGPSVR